MGNRLSKIYTRTGDDGTTGLGDGSRVAKDSVRVEAYGTVDELNSAVGVLLAVSGLPPAITSCLTQCEQELVEMGGERCIPGPSAITAAQVSQLEQALDGFNDALPPLKEFILPGGGPAAAACHLARTVARRGERRVGSAAPRCWGVTSAPEGHSAPSAGPGSAASRTSARDRPYVPARYRCGRRYA